MGVKDTTKQEGNIESSQSEASASRKQSRDKSLMCIIQPQPHKNVFKLIKKKSEGIVAATFRNKPTYLAPPSPVPAKPTLHPPSA